MEASLEQIKKLITEGKTISLAEDLSIAGKVLINKNKVLSTKDVERLNEKVQRKLKIRLVEDFSVPTKLKEDLLAEIRKILNNHKYYKHLTPTVKQKIDKTISNFFPHSDYLSYVLKHIYGFSKPLFNHSVHVSIFSLIMDMNYQMSFNNGFVDSLKLENVFIGALLHDMGYMSINKEFSTMKRSDKSHDNAEYAKHPSQGFELLKRDEKKHNYHPDILNIVLHHEERIDCSGFPSQLSGQFIIEGAKIVAFCNELEHLLKGDILPTKVSSFLDLTRYFANNKSQFDPNCIEVFNESFHFLDDYFI